MPHNFIKTLRLNHTLTQNEMAEVLHISQNAYSLIESGKTRLIDLERIKIMAEKFNLSSQKLIEGLTGVVVIDEEESLFIKELIHQLDTKDKRIEKLLSQNEKLIEALNKK